MSDPKVEASGAAETGQTAAPRTVYSIFGKLEKCYIVILIAVAGWFSTLSSFIYYPVITFVARDLHTTVAKINLTVTSYMVVSGIAPAIVGDAADMLGRRPMYVVTLAIYFVANVGIAVQKSFVALLLLRMLQSAGISGVFSIAYGVLADISTPAERGTYVGALSLGITTAPSIGPLLGGVIGARAGWRWIFWFLCIVSGACLAAMILSLPETARNLVGNGSIRPPPGYRLPFPRIMEQSRSIDQDAVPEFDRESHWHIPNPIKCLVILSRTDTFLVVTAGGIIYMSYCCLQASLSSLFVEVYGLGQLEAGLIYLPFGVGGIVITLISGKILDRDYRITAKAHNITIDKVHGDDLLTFPVEKARLRSVFVPISIVIISTIGYGWSLQTRAHMAVPLVLQFILGLTVQMCFNVNNTLLIDINHTAPATAQASSNIVRCALAAVAVAVLQDIIDAINVGWTFTLLGSLCSVSALLYLIDRQHGMRFRVAQGQESASRRAEVSADDTLVGRDVELTKKSEEQRGVTVGEKS
ncbi:MAG: hypothetical protein M1837_003218 [Sclerophora amabilis]|nr:MAG: hypothetical protein M1837_003218 [Sclerophora amabilis]